MKIQMEKNAVEGEKRRLGPCWNPVPASLPRPFLSLGKEDCFYCCFPRGKDVLNCGGRAKKLKDMHVIQLGNFCFQWSAAYLC